MTKKINEQKLTVKAPYFTYVWAEDETGLIGSKGKLPWNLPAEMQYFVEVTVGDVVVMGRKSYESIPNPPLRDRINIVLTRNTEYEAEGAVVCHNKEEILAYLKEKEIKQPIHIIGGSALFELFMDDVAVLYRTVVHAVFEGDVYMPELPYEQFGLVDQAKGVVDEENEFAHTYYLYERKELPQLK